MSGYFVFTQTDPKGQLREFVFFVQDPAKAQEARAILSDPKATKRSVSGTIVRQPVWYNPGWSFHLDPASINFFQLAMEVCDANATWVEENLPTLGGDALPGLFWCPWSPKLDREVTPEPDPAR